MDKKLYNEICVYFRHTILPGTEYAGHVYTVGGCNRDIIMGMDPHDIDICIDLVNGGISFAEYLYNNGYLLYEPAYFPAYGTSSFILKEFPDVTIEAVMTRKEQYKNGNSRNPDTVFGSITEDALRRDLTINSIYYNISTDEYFDPNNGREDIKNKIIRTPQNPAVIFEDDPLRILRVIRFSLRFSDFSIDKELSNMIIKKRPRLSILKQERITAEISKIFDYCDFSLFVRTINQYKLSEFLFPELAYVFYKKLDKFNTPYGYPGTIKNMNDSYYWALILSSAQTLYNNNVYSSYEHYENLTISNDIIELCTDILKRMKYPNSVINETLKYFNVWNTCKSLFHKTPLTAFRQMQYYSGSKEVFNNMHNFFMNLFYLNGNGFLLQKYRRDYEDYMRDTSEDKMGYNITLAITGNDIMTSLNIPSGPDIKKYLNCCLELVLNNPTLNNKTDLLNFISLISCKH